jgi:Tfp pilus assembly protein PilF
MKRLAALLVLVMTVVLLPARAQQGPDDQYVIIYSLMQQADMLNNTGQPRQALDHYRQVQSDLKKFQNIFPDWNPQIVNFRLNYLSEKIAEVSAKLPATNAPPVAETNAPPTGAVAPAAALEAQLSALHEQVQQLRAGNTTLEAKLKEALATQPAAADPRELARAREQIRSLLKENDLLKAGQLQAPPKPAVSADVRALQAALAGANRKLAEQTARGEKPAATADPRELARAREQIQSLMKENNLLKTGQLQSPRGPAVSADVNALQEALAGANRKLTEQTAHGDKLALDNQALEARVKSLLAGSGAVEALLAENRLLKKQLVDSKTATAPAVPETGDVNRQLAQARAEIALLQSDAEVAWLEKITLENRVRQLQTAAAGAAVVSPPARAENEARIRELERERNSLLEKLSAANQELYGRKNQPAAAKIEELAGEVDALRARLAVYEAHAVPYTPEELALFKQSEPKPLAANPNAEKKSIHELPAGSVNMVAEAQGYFAAKQYDKAEDAYLQILRRDENNALALANLAAIELEQNKLDDAEKHIKTALAQKSDDAYNLSILGYLKFRQEKYDDALDALSRAAKLDPQNPEIENYLGVTLGHKGLRTQAETALRKAIQLDPNYAPAHNNLAVIYVSQQPPLVELARWHYQKALAAGQPRNPDLEKTLEEKSAALKAP